MNADATQALADATTAEADLELRLPLTPAAHVLHPIVFEVVPDALRPVLAARPGRWTPTATAASAGPGSPPELKGVIGLGGSSPGSRKAVFSNAPLMIRPCAAPQPICSPRGTLPRNPPLLTAPSGKRRFKEILWIKSFDP